MSPANNPQLPDAAVVPPPRRPPLPAVGLPVARERRRGWALGSLLLHILLIALLITPLATHEGIVIERPQGAGGPGAAGGGGGGRGGSGGGKTVVEHLQYVALVPIPELRAEVIPPVVTPPPKPVVVPPPEPVKIPDPTEMKVELKMEPVKASEVPSQTVGTGGGSGHDGSAGNGPGSGGGVGSGIGPGRGSGIGPGSGGGVQADYPPSPTELFIPPLPMPDKVRGFRLVAEYDIDATGKILDFTFSPTRDGDYNKRLREVLGSFRFRPGTRPDGTPIRMKAQIIYDF
jgi:periplasmic protein TonB